MVVVSCGSPTVVLRLSDGPINTEYPVPVLGLYDTICYFNVRSKADISQLNLPHENDN